MSAASALANIACLPTDSKEFQDAVAELTVAVDELNTAAHKADNEPAPPYDEQQHSVIPYYVPVFPEEVKGWSGYLEWERHPERAKAAAEILAKHSFPHPPEFQLVPLPKTNPILTGERFKQYHSALGPGLDWIPKRSWEIVKEEKAADMLHVLQFPYNGETPRDRLHNAITRNEDFYVRNHGGIPEIDEAAYFLDIGGLVNKPQRLTLSDLKDEKKFPRMTQTVTLQCSGTRRLEQINTYPGDGDELINAPWGEGAIGNAVWTGVSLKKVIKYCGGLATGAKHLEFFGADTYFKKGKVMNYAVSIPWRKVRIGEVMLAWEMNGKPLPKIHGAPLRVVVFGYIGARSVKWVTRIDARAEESPRPVQRHEYLYYTMQQSKYNSTFSAGHSIQDMPVSSALLYPLNQAVVIHDGKLDCGGWAYSGGGHWPVRVEVSVDGGSVWYQTAWDRMSAKGFYAWRTWEASVPCDAEGWIEVCVRCWDDANNTQPTFQRSAWNWDLHVTSSCHRVNVFSVNKSKPDTKRRLEAMEKAGEDVHNLTRPLGVEPETDEQWLEVKKRMGEREPDDDVVSETDFEG